MKDGDKENEMKCYKWKTKWQWENCQLRIACPVIIIFQDEGEEIQTFLEKQKLRDSLAEDLLTETC